MVGKWRRNAYITFKADEAEVKDGGHTTKDVYTAPHLKTRQETELTTKPQAGLDINLYISTVAFSNASFSSFLNAVQLCLIRAPRIVKK